MTRVVTNSIRWAALSLLAVLGFAGEAKALPFPITLFNTGVDAVGAQLPPGAPDLNWSQTPGLGNPALVLTDQTGGTGAFYAQSTDSRWVWRNAAGTGTGTTTFELLFFLPSNFDPGQGDLAFISGFWGVDNTGVISLNGGPTTGGGLSLTPDSQQNFRMLHGFFIDGNFQPGANFLNITVNNSGGAAGLNVSGLRGNYEIIRNAAVPEPSALLYFGIGIAGMAGYIWRRRKPALV